MFKRKQSKSFLCMILMFLMMFSNMDAAIFRINSVYAEVVEKNHLETNKNDDKTLKNESVETKSETPEEKDAEAPKIEVIGIEDGQEVIDKEISFKVTVTDNVDKDIQATVKINNEIITGTNGEYKAQLEYGENIITIETIDADGNKAEKNYKVILKKEFTTTSRLKPNIRINGFSDEGKVEQEKLKFDITFKHITEEPTVKFNDEIITGKVLDLENDLYKVEYEVVLSEGKNILNINATNINARNENNKNISSIYTINKVKDATPPVIETDLKNNMEVEDKEFTFYVKAIDNIDGEVEVKVTLNNKEVEGINGSYKVILEDLKNIIKIEAKDSSNNITTENNYFTINRKDKEAPEIETDLIDGRTVINDEIAFNVSVKDNSGYAEAIVKLNGKELNKSQKGYSGKLQDGKNLIYIEASDKSDNKSVKEYTIIKIDPSQDKEAPKLEVEGIYDGQKLKTSKLNFKIKVIDNLDINVKEVVEFNKEILTGSNGEYKLILKNGENTIRIEATDIAGNKVDKTYKVTYDINLIKSIKITNELSNIKVGNEIELEAYDQDNEKVDTDELVFSVNNEKKGKIIEKKGNNIFKALEAGEVSLSVALKQNKDKKQTVSFDIKANKKKVYMRIEGYDRTILPRTSMEVSLYDLSKDLGKADGSSATDSNGWAVENFSEPTNAHAIVHALKNYCNMHPQNRVEEKDGEDNFDFQDYGWSLYIAMIGGDREFAHGQMSGWMYRVNDVLVPVGCNAANLEDGDEILWYYGAFGFDNVYTKLECDSNKIRPGQEIKLHAKGFKGGYSNDEINLEDAIILVNGEEYKEDGKAIKTDIDGNATIKLNNTGKYEISLVRFKPGNGVATGTEQIDIVRPLPVILEVSNDSDVDVPEEKDTEAPKIEVSGIIYGQEVSDKEISFKITVTDNVDKDIKAIVKVNNEVITGKNGKYKAQLKDGENIVTVEAVDTAGNKSSEVYKITYKKKTEEEKTKEELYKKILEILPETVDFATKESYSNDWVTAGLGRLEDYNHRISPSYLEETAEAVKNLAANQDNGSGSFKVTDFERMTMGILSAGGDPTSIGGMNIIERIYNPRKKGDVDYITRQGLNAVIWGLIAVDSKNYEIPEDAEWNRDKFVKEILKMECKNEGHPILKGKKGGWQFGGNKTIDPDMTGMAMIALAPYYNSRQDVKDAVDRAVENLSLIQMEDGGYASWGTVNSESCVQVIMGLCANNFDPTGEMFTRPNGNVVDALMRFKIEGTGFAHAPDPMDGNKLKPNGMATEQALYGMAQVLYSLDGNNGSIFNWGDEKPEGSEKFVANRVGQGSLNKGSSAEVKFNIENISEKDEVVTLAIVLYDNKTNEMKNYSFAKKTLKAKEKEEFAGGFIIPKEGDYVIKAIICDDLNTEKMNVLLDPIKIMVE